MQKFISLFFVTLCMGVLSLNAHALTLKSGQVLGSDGKVYDGATPTTIQNIAKSGKPTGVTGNNLFVVIEDDVAFIPLSEIVGKTKAQMKQVVRDRLIEHLTKNLTKVHTNPDGTVDTEAVARDMSSFDGANDDMADGFAQTLSAAAAHSDAALAQAQQVIADAVELTTRTVSDPAFERSLEANFETLHGTACAGREGSGQSSGISDGAGGTHGC